MHDVANARDDRTRQSFRWKARRLLHPAPEKQDDEKRQIKERIRSERGDRPCRRDNDPADRRTKAAGNVVADAVERHGRG